MRYYNTGQVQPQPGKTFGTGGLLDAISSHHPFLRTNASLQFAGAIHLSVQLGIHHSHQASEYPLSQSYLRQDEPAKRLQKE